MHKVKVDAIAHATRREKIKAHARIKARINANWRTEWEDDLTIYRPAPATSTAHTATN